MQPINFNWLQRQVCTGDTVALISASSPSLVDVVTGVLPEVHSIAAGKPDPIGARGFGEFPGKDYQSSLYNTKNISAHFQNDLTAEFEFSLVGGANK